jgi:SAM-dependent methyltransferase
VLQSLDRLSRSLERRGVRGTLRLVAVDVRYRIVRPVRYALELEYDLLHGVRTRGVVAAPVLGYSDGDLLRYEVTPWRRRLLGVLESLGIRYEDFAFVDVGCGKGRMLLLAARLPFTRVIGVELSAECAERARENVAAYRGGRGADAPVEVVCADATRYRLPDDPLVLYLYNPFKGEVLARFLAGVRRSVEEHPRPVYIIYVQPESRELFDAAPFLRELSAGERYVVYAAS